MITLAHIFYNQHRVLPFHSQAWNCHPENKFLYTVIDDSSDAEISLSIFGAGLSIYRVLHDIPWNIAGARNLAFHTATTEWVYCGDIDHVVTQEAGRSMLELDFRDPNIVYTFRRQEPSTGYVGVNAIINILMNRKKFFEIGGYDEDFSGGYGREEVFFQNCLSYHNIRNVRCDNIVLEWRRDIGTTLGLSRDKTRNSALYEKKKAELQKGTYKNGPLLRFKWKKLGEDN